MASIGKQDSGKAELENRTVDTMVGDGSATTLVLSSAPISINNVLIFISGIMQRPTTDYTLSGSTITFSEAPIAGLKVVAITGGGEHIGIPLTKLGTDKFMDIAVTDAKIASGISASKLTGALPAIDGSAVTGVSGANVSGVDTVTTSDPAINTNPAAAGHIWLNRTSAEMFVCTDNTAGANIWINVGEGTGSVPYMTATNTNGTETIDGNYKVVTFNTSGSFTPSIGSDASVGDKVEYLVVAGGGGSSSNQAGGGGAGGYLAATNFTVTSTAITVTVGAGGVGVASNQTPNNGGNSVFGSITSTGGGGGSPAQQNGLSGGSGGGGGVESSSAGSASPAGQGNAGGTGAVSSPNGGGGGGGAGAVGTNNGGSGASHGGVGLANDIKETGTNVFYAGGGGGASHTGQPVSNGGNGGGGIGGIFTGAPGNGTVNLGGGGGGQQAGNLNGGSGGSGVVIVRYRFK